MRYVIRNDVDDQLFWSNLYGWVETQEDIYSQEDRLTLALPLGGIWVKVNEDMSDGPTDRRT